MQLKIELKYHVDDYTNRIRVIQKIETMQTWILIQLLGPAELKPYPFAGDQSNAAQRHMPSSAGDKTLEKRVAMRQKLCCIDREIILQWPRVHITTPIGGY
jgi:hypothetical protein